MSETTDRPPNNQAAADAELNIGPDSQSERTVVAQRLLSDSTVQPSVATTNLARADIPTANTLPNITLASAQGPGFTANLDSTVAPQRVPFSENRLVNFAVGTYRGAVNTVIGTASSIFNPAQLIDHTARAAVTVGDAAINPVRTWNSVSTAAQNADAEQWGNVFGTAATAIGLGFVGSRVPENGSILINNARTRIPAVESLATRANLPPVAGVVRYELPEMLRASQTGTLNATSHIAGFEPVFARTAGLRTGPVPATSTWMPQAAAPRPISMNVPEVIGSTQASLAAPQITLAARWGLTTERTAGIFAPIEPYIPNFVSNIPGRIRDLNARMPWSSATRAADEIPVPGPPTFSSSTSFVSNINGRIIRSADDLTAGPTGALNLARTGETLAGPPLFRSSHVQNISGYAPTFLRVGENVQPRLVTNLGAEIQTGILSRNFLRVPTDTASLIGRINHTPAPIGGFRTPLTFVDDITANASIAARTPVARIEAQALAQSRIPFAATHDASSILRAARNTATTTEATALRTADITAGINSSVTTILRRTENPVSFTMRRDLQNFSSLANQLETAPFKSRILASMDEIAPRIESVIPNPQRIVRNLHIAETSASLTPERVSAGLARVVRPENYTAAHTAEVNYFNLLAQNRAAVPRLLDKAEPQLRNNPALLAQVQDVSRSIASGGNVNDAIARLTDATAQAGVNNKNLNQALRLLTDQRTLGTEVGVNVYNRIHTQLNEVATTFSRARRSELLAGLDQDAMRMRHLMQNTNLGMIHPNAMTRHALDLQERVLAHQRVFDPLTWRGYAAIAGGSAFMMGESYMRNSIVDPEIQRDRARLLNRPRVESGDQRSSLSIPLSTSPDMRHSQTQERTNLQARTNFSNTQLSAQSYSQSYLGPMRSPASFANRQELAHMQRPYSQEELRYSANNLYRNAFNPKSDDENSTFNMAWAQYAGLSTRTDTTTNLVSNTSQFFTPENNLYVHMVSGRNTWDRPAASAFNFTSPITSQMARLDSRYTTASETNVRSSSSVMQASAMMSSNLRTSTAMRTSSGLSLTSLEKGISSGSIGSLSSPLVAHANATANGVYASTSYVNPQVSSILAALPALSVDPQSQASQNV